uniref:Uncharacterized protein n=2 Tax=Cercopithecinae TaxID=9528 RepID=A0A2K5MQB4_CERAT
MYLHCFTFLREKALLTSPELSTPNNLCHFQRCKIVLFECLIISTLGSLFSPLQMAQ